MELSDITKNSRVVYSDGVTDKLGVIARDRTPGQRFAYIIFDEETVEKGCDVRRITLVRSDDNDSEA